MALAQPSFIFHVPRRRQSPPTSIYSENEAGKDSVAAAHDDERERAVVAPSPSLPRFSLSFVCVAVRTFTSPRRHAHIADDRARKITWRCHRLGRFPPESAYRCRHHMGNVAHWKRSLQLQLYLRSNIIRLSRRST